MRYKIIEIFKITFCAKSFKSGVYFTFITRPNLVVKFSLKVFDLQLDFMKQTVEKVDSHIQVTANILKSSPIIEWSTSF